MELSCPSPQPPVPAPAALKPRGDNAGPSRGQGRRSAAGAGARGGVEPRPQRRGRAGRGPCARCRRPPALPPRAGLGEIDTKCQQQERR